MIIQGGRILADCLIALIQTLCTFLYSAVSCFHSLNQIFFFCFTFLFLCQLQMHLVKGQGVKGAQYHKTHLRFILCWEENVYGRNGSNQSEISLIWLASLKSELGDWLDKGREIFIIPQSSFWIIRTLYLCYNKCFELCQLLHVSYHLKTLPVFSLTIIFI